MAYTQDDLQKAASMVRSLQKRVGSDIDIEVIRDSDPQYVLLVAHPANDHSTLLAKYYSQAEDLLSGEHEEVSGLQSFAQQAVEVYRQWRAREDLLLAILLGE